MNVLIGLCLLALQPASLWCRSVERAVRPSSESWSSQETLVPTGTSSPSRRSKLAKLLRPLIEGRLSDEIRSRRPKKIIQVQTIRGSKGRDPSWSAINPRKKHVVEITPIRTKGGGGKPLAYILSPAGVQHLSKRTGKHQKDRQHKNHVKTVKSKSRSGTPEEVTVTIEKSQHPHSDEQHSKKEDTLPDSDSGQLSAPLSSEETSHSKNSKSTDNSASSSSRDGHVQNDSVTSDTSSQDDSDVTSEVSDVPSSRHVQKHTSSASTSSQQKSSESKSGETSEESSSAVENTSGSNEATSTAHRSDSTQSSSQSDTNVSHDSDNQDNEVPAPAVHVNNNDKIEKHGPDRKEVTPNSSEEQSTSNIKHEEDRKQDEKDNHNANNPVELSENKQTLESYKANVPIKDSSYEAKRDHKNAPKHSRTKHDPSSHESNEAKSGHDKHSSKDIVKTDHQHSKSHKSNTHVPRSHKPHSEETSIQADEKRDARERQHKNKHADSQQLPESDEVKPVDENLSRIDPNPDAQVSKDHTSSVTVEELDEVDETPQKPEVNINTKEEKSEDVDNESKNEPSNEHRRPKVRENDSKETRRTQSKEEKVHTDESNTNESGQDLNDDNKTSAEDKQEKFRVTDELKPRAAADKLDLTKDDDIQGNAQQRSSSDTIIPTTITESSPRSLGDNKTIKKLLKKLQHITSSSSPSELEQADVIVATPNKLKMSVRDGDDVIEVKSIEDKQSHCDTPAKATSRASRPYEHKTYKLTFIFNK